MKKNKEEIIELLSKTQEKVQIDYLRDLLDFQDNKEFNLQIFDWAKRFNFKIDGEYLLFKIESVEYFLRELNELYKVWNISTEKDKK